MSLKLRPLNDRVVVKPSEGEDKTQSGIYLPETAKEKPQQGEIIAVGPGRFDEDGEKRLPLDVQVGDTVLYAKYGGTEVKLEGETVLIMKESDILAVLEQA